MLVLIDGYNFLGRQKGLRGNLEVKRKKLIEDLSRYHQIKGLPITVVFDGWKTDEGWEHEEKIKGVSVIFSRGGEKADEVIARLAGKKRNRCIVVTSDRELQKRVQGAGATTMFSGEFEAKLLNAFFEKESFNPWEKEDWDEVQSKPKKTKKGNPFRSSKAERRKQAKLKKL